MAAGSLANMAEMSAPTLASPLNASVQARRRRCAACGAATPLAVKQLRLPAGRQAANLSRRALLHVELPSPRARSAQNLPRAQVEGRGSQPG